MSAGDPSSRMAAALMFCTLATPMTLSLAASFNQDGLLIACSVLAAALVITLGAKQPLDFSVFPSLLLLFTLLRLTLNVATTRSILLHGEAGSIVRAFGDYVVQRNLLVGLVVFGILVVIQFIVVTKGAGRISEVAARFILDANREWGTTVILIEHDMAVVMDISERVTVLDRGRKIAEGSPGEVQRHPEVIRAYLGTAKIREEAAE